MPSIKDLTLVTVENFHEIVPNFLNTRKLLISSYEDMMEAIAQMVQEKHLFNMDRELLRDMMADLTFMCCPGDDINKERVMLQLVPSDDEGDSDDEDYSEDTIPPQVKVDSLVASDIDD